MKAKLDAELESLQRHALAMAERDGLPKILVTETMEGTYIITVPGLTKTQAEHVLDALGGII